MVRRRGGQRMSGTQNRKKRKIKKVFGLLIFWEDDESFVIFDWGCSPVLRTPFFFLLPVRPSPMVSAEKRRTKKRSDTGLVFLYRSKQTRVISLSLQKFFIFANRCVGPRGFWLWGAGAKGVGVSN